MIVIGCDICVDGLLLCWFCTRQEEVLSLNAVTRRAFEGPIMDEAFHQPPYQSLCTEIIQNAYQALKSLLTPAKNALLLFRKRHSLTHLDYTQTLANPSSRKSHPQRPTPSIIPETYMSLGLCFSCRYSRRMDAELYRGFESHVSRRIVFPTSITSPISTTHHIMPTINNQDKKKREKKKRNYHHLRL